DRAAGSDRGSVCGARAISSVLPRQGGHRRGPWRRFSSDGQDYLTVLSPLSFLFDLSTGNHVLEKIEEIHRLVHEVPGDPISRVVERETKKPRPCSCFFAIVVISDLSSFAIEGASCGAIPTIGNKGCEKGPGRVRHDGNLYRGVRCAAVGLVV